MKILVLSDELDPDLGETEGYGDGYGYGSGYSYGDGDGYGVDDGTDNGIGGLKQNEDIRAKR